MTKQTYPKLFLILLTMMSGLTSLSTGQTYTTGTSESVSTTAPEQLVADISTALGNAEKLKAAKPESASAATTIDLLNQASEQLKLRDKYTSETREHDKAVREAPAQLEAVKAALQKDDSSTSATEIPTTVTVEGMEQHLAVTEAELKSLKQRLDQIDGEQKRREKRTELIPAELVKTRQNLGEAKISIQAQSGAEDPAVANARSLLSQARILAAQAHVESLEKEQDRYDAREELLPLARQLVAERISEKQTYIKTISDKLTDLRKNEASQSARELKQLGNEARTSHPLIQTVASENTSITAEMNLGSIVASIDTASEKLNAITAEAALITDKYQNLRAKFESVGYSDALGVVLRKQQKELPDLRGHREALELRAEKLTEVNLQLLKAQDITDELVDPEATARELSAEAGIDIATTTGESISSEISHLLKARGDYMAKVRDAYDKLFQTMVKLNSSEEELVRQTSAFREFIDERILWLPSTENISGHHMLTASAAFVQLLEPSTWITYANVFLEQGKARLFSFSAGALLLLIIVLSHHYWKRRLKDTLASASHNRLTAFKPLIQCFAYAAFYALPLPALMIAAGWPLANRYHIPLDVSSLAHGLMRGGIALFILQFMQTVIRRHGIADVFFVWPEASLRKLHRTFSILIWVYIPCVVLVRMWEFHGGDGGMEAARIVLVAALLVVAALAFRLLLPKSGVFVGTAAYRGSGVVYKLRYVLLVALPAIPATLAIAALFGYVYTAIELTQRLNVSFWLGITVLLLSETALFWILVKRRRLAIEETRKRRETASTHKEGESRGIPDVVEPTLDIASIGRQAGRLVRVVVLGFFIIGLWGVWADVLPALHYLDSHPLWSVSKQVTETTSDGTIQKLDKLSPVTVADMLLVALIIIGAIGALRNLPGLLDITVYQKFKVQQGERYAFNTLIRYVIIIVGVVYICSLMGLQWEQIQWAVAGVSVGLGFGLQEIFANFVSGLILLFERPVRVGDLVTVGDMTGNVSQIRIRATTVVSWDHNEYIIPNKELITKPVQNWTLNDMRRRLVITVGVAYGSDYDKAREILLKVARENPHVLDDPAPSAAIEKMSASSVDFVLYVHLPNADNLLDARHGIIAEIEHQFTAAGIEIPFPRMDVRLERGDDPSPSNRKT